MKYSYIWSQYTFSKTLDVQDKTLTGLWLLLSKLSDFLYKGLTSASFNCGGKHDSLIDKFISAGNSPVPVNSPHKGQWRGALMFSLIYVWINGWVNNREASDLRRHRGHYDVSVMSSQSSYHNYNTGHRDDIQR